MIEFSVHMQNRPGELATIARELGTAGVNIETLAAITRGSDGYIKLVVDDDNAARKILADAGIDFEERRVVSATLRDKPGALADFTEALAYTGVNIEAMYLLHAEDDDLHFAIAVTDAEAFREHLAAAD